MRILFLSTWFPYPPDNGSKLRVYSLLRGLSQRHDVTLISFADHPLDSLPTELTALCESIKVVPRRNYSPLGARATVGLFSPKPRVLVDTYEPRMAELIRQELKRDRYDLAIASQLATAAYWTNSTNLPALFEEMELGVFEAKKAQAESPFLRLRHELPLLKLRWYLGRLLPHFRACTVVSDEEAMLFRRMVSGDHLVRVIPNCIDLEDYYGVRRAPQPNTLIFTGSFRYFANHDAVDWFLRNVYPRVQAAVPGVHLVITGDHANLTLPPSAKDVTLTGFVSDVHQAIASSWISLAPIRFGGGTRLKILEAMALGTPVVATSKGAEGLDVQHDEHLLVADTPEAFAEAIIRLLKEPALRNRLAQSAFQLVSEKYNWKAVMPYFENLLEQVVRS